VTTVGTRWGRLCCLFCLVTPMMMMTERRLGSERPCRRRWWWPLSLASSIDRSVGRSLLDARSEPVGGDTGLRRLYTGSHTQKAARRRLDLTERCRRSPPVFAFAPISMPARRPVPPARRCFTTTVQQQQQQQQQQSHR
jgi:hypothetical protein